jgi:hypothetical protein
MISIEPGFTTLLIFVPLILSLFSVLYLAHAYTEKIERLLSCSAFVKHHRETFSGLGFIGKVVRIGFIAITLSIPKVMARRGGVDISQLKTFPYRLKLLLVGSWAVLFLSCAAMMLFVPKA